MNPKPHLFSPLILHILATVCTTISFLNAAPPPSAFGVWDRSGKFDPTQFSFIRGSTFDQAWSEVEPMPLQYDWSGLDQAMEKANKNQQFVYLSLGVGPEAPDWIYQQGVPKVLTMGEKQKHDNKWHGYPYYLDPQYKTAFRRLIAEWAKHIRTYPKETQQRIAFIQVKTGCTGDETPYKGKAIDPKYHLTRSSDAWRTFRLDAFAQFVQLFQNEPDQPRIDLLFNSIGPVAGTEEDGTEDFSTEWKWVLDHIHGSFGIKNGALSRGHHLAGERSLYEQWTPLLIDPQGLTLFRRSEMDQTWQKPYYQLNVPLNFYWGAINALNGGQSIWDVTKSAIEASQDQGFDFSFHFFNRYAGQIHPNTATGAFCALHKGLDAADTIAYPEEKFGKATQRNTERMLKICAEYARYGASVDDRNALTLNQVRQRDSQKGFNDVGWQIWPDNYSRFLYQIDADQTSIPLWRIGGPITKTSSIYARFARGFEHQSHKDLMLFKLHDGFSTKKPQTVTFHIVWFDQHPGSSWKLLYDAGQSDLKTALHITGTGDLTWHHETITLHDAIFNHNGQNGADLALLNTDDKDDIFSLIEIQRAPPQTPPTNQP